MALPSGGFSKLTNLQIAEKNVVSANEELTTAGLAGDIVAEATPVLYTVSLKQAGTSTLSKADFDALLKSIKLSE